MSLNGISLVLSQKETISHIKLINEIDSIKYQI